MNLCSFHSGNSIYTNCECIKGYAFKMSAPRGKSAIMRAENLEFSPFNPSMDNGIPSHICQDIFSSVYNCAHFDQLTVSGLSPFHPPF